VVVEQELNMVVVEVLEVYFIIQVLLWHPELML
jgi:hypothetical protein